MVNLDQEPLFCKSCHIAIFRQTSDTYFTCDETCDFDICPTCTKCDKKHTLVRKDRSLLSTCKKCNEYTNTLYECLADTCRHYDCCAECLNLATDID